MELDGGSLRCIRSHLDVEPRLVVVLAMELREELRPMGLRPMELRVEQRPMGQVVLQQMVPMVQQLVGPMERRLMGPVVQQQLVQLEVELVGQIEMVS